MSVHQLRDGRWFVQFRDKDTDKIKREYFGRGFEAETKAKERQSSLDLRSYQKRTPKRKSPLFDDLVRAYMTAQEGRIQNSTLDAFTYKMSGVILPEIGQLPAIRITAYRMDLYVQKRLKKVKRTTVHREITDIQAVLNWSVKRKYLSHNPIAGFEKPKRDDEIIQPPTADEIQKMLEHSPPHVLRCICVSYYTGPRPGQVELLNLTWSNVNWNDLSIRIRSARKGGRFKYRDVPLHPDFANLLYIWHREDIKEGKEETDPIITYKGQKIKRFIKAFNKAKENAKITRRLPPYSFRHAFATALLKSSADLKSTSELLGHSRTDTTTKIYQHTDLEIHRETIRRLPPLKVPQK